MPTKAFQDIGTRYGSDYVIAIGDVGPNFKTNGMATFLDVVNQRQVCGWSSPEKVDRQGAGFCGLV